MQRAYFSIFSMSAAASSVARTGVLRVPMILGLVMTAPSQWKKFNKSPPQMPGKKYLLPPEKPTTSCGKTGPAAITRS